jgi:SWI/SNF-related matrix-associated actin-dependent regulator 1 of chromatin subfamily A
MNNGTLSLLPYQEEGVRFLQNHCAALLADEMGLGKTVQAIALIDAEPTIRTVLIVCPATLKAIWQSELQRWLHRTDLSICTIDSTQWKEAAVTIINYDRLHQHEIALYRRQWDLVIIDECHYLKSSHTRRTIVATRLRARRRLAMSGTPLLNRPRELLPVLTWLDSIIWPHDKWHEFGLRYCGAVWNGFGWEYRGATNLEELGNCLRSTVMLRRTKAEVLPELPPKFRSVVELAPDMNLARLVRAELQAFEQYLERQGDLDKTCQQQSAELRQAYRDSVRTLRYVSDDSLGDNLAKARHAVALAKVPLIGKFVDELFMGGSGKLTIFCHHRDVILGLEKLLAAYHPVLLHGGTSQTARMEAVTRFQNDLATRVFIGNIQAAGVGITLAPASAHCIFAELSWVPAEITQAEDRLHRIGAKDNVLVQHLVLAGSLDAVLVRTLLTKQKILDRILVEEVKILE